MEKTDGRRRVRTGIRGLDEILRGGLPRDRMYVIEGDPGAGKAVNKNVRASGGRG